MVRMYARYGFVGAVWLFGLLVLVLALVGRIPRRQVGMSVLLVLLFFLQSVLVEMQAPTRASRRSTRSTAF